MTNTMSVLQDLGAEVSRLDLCTLSLLAPPPAPTVGKTPKWDNGPTSFFFFFFFWFFETGFLCIALAVLELTL